MTRTHGAAPAPPTRAAPPRGGGPVVPRNRARAALRDAAAPLLRRGPDFLIVGAQKAGTTSLHRYLARHPRLRPCAGPKELHYFDLRYHRGPGWYRSHFPVRLGARGRLLFEATPDYLCHAVVPGRIRRDLGAVRLIAVLREPAARAYSAWRMWHGFAGRPEDAARADPRSFAAAIEDELRAPESAARGHFHYVAMGRYADHVAAYREHFAPGEMLILDHAEMGRDLHGFLGRICGFLDVPPFAPEAVEAMAGERHWVGPDWPVTAEVEAALARLREHYAPHNRRLFDLLGRRFDW